MSDSPATPTAPTLPETWVAYIGPFAAALGKTPEEATALLREVVGEPGDQAIDLLKDAAMAPDADIKAKLNGTPPAVANLAISKLRAAPVASTTTAAAVASFGGMTSFNVLPEVPSESAWLTALRAGGVLKVDQSTVISAIRAALAHRAGLYGIPDTLTRLMEDFADTNAEQVDAEFFKLRRMLTRRNYADIFEAIDGLDGTFVTEARKKQLLRRIDEHLWPSIVSFNQQLKNWVESWQGSANPAMMGMMLMAGMSGGASGVLPPGMLQPPDTGVLRDAADGVNDDINRVFAGVGKQISAALAYDAGKIKETLENPQLPGLIGAANREQMLRQMRVEVSAAYPRMETNLTRFVLSILGVKDVVAGNEEVQYFNAMYMLGSQIPWDKLNETSGSEVGGRTGIGKRPADRL